MTPARASDSVAEHEARNRALVARIVAKGGSLTVTRALDLFFWAPSQATATSLAEALRAMGLTSLSVTPAADGRPTWAVQGQLNASVQHVASSSLTEQLVHLAAQHGSDYDGWGTEL